MPGRSHARYLAPFALVAFLIALALVVTSSGDGGSDANGAATAPTSREQPAGGEEGREEETSRRRTGPRRYTVQPGDTPGTIAEKTGVPLEQLEELNPDIDPQQLAPGERLRLRR